MQNILKEIYDDLKRPSSCLDGDLTPWANEGVLLLNTILTVEESKAKSHHNLGWEIFTDNIIKFISQNCEDVVFLLWGSRITSYNVCYTKLLRSRQHDSAEPRCGQETQVSWQLHRR